MLRPIGAEFWYEFPVFPGDSRAVQERFLYRVVSHDNIHPRGQAERIEPVEHEIRHITGYHQVKLSDRTIWDYDFGPWQKCA